ncbi:hypothetical protein DXG03_001445 [Asterophora parasitica]|uniref:Uncharacterized protein n=1 Tax=Asterophora parasitica TaxID=117018 RepID=A0A9P7GCZ2_9AGAR|nr:hypothetical protein DXG03_001445 [Asterophora parasitica]
MPQVNVADDEDADEGPVWWRNIRKHLNFYRIHVMHYFAIKFKHVLKANAEKRASETLTNAEKRGLSNWPSRISTFLRGGHADISVVTEVTENRQEGERKKGLIQKLRPDMIRRMDDEPKRINPSGFAVGLKKPQAPTTTEPHPGHLSWAPSSSDHKYVPQPSSRRSSVGYDGESKRSHFRRLSDPGVPSRPSTPIGASLVRSGTLQDSPHDTPIPPSLVSPDFSKTFTRTQTIEFAPNAPRRRGRVARGLADDEIPESGRPEPEPLQNPDRRSMHSRRASLSRQPSIATAYTRSGSMSYKNRDFGGFPMPHVLVKNLFSRLFPKFRRRVTRTVTIPATMSLVSQSHRGGDVPTDAKAVPYISFNATVGRNSAFQHLSHEEMEELGGVEYRALNALLWIIGGVRFLS